MLSQAQFIQIFKIFAIALLLLVLQPLSAQLQLPALLSDGVVLQRNKPLKITGWSALNETVQLLFKDKLYQTQADEQGRWAFELPPQNAGGPYDMVFMAADTLVLKDVLLGDVWVSSGQSNMELTIQRVYETYKSELQGTNNEIRYFDVPDRYDFKKTRDDLDGGNWIKAAPESIRQFSAVAYFFANHLYAKYKVPVGIINASVGGSPVEAWMSETALQSFPKAHAELQRFKNDSLIAALIAGDQKRSSNWYQQLDSLDTIQHLLHAGSAFISTDDWKSFQIPGYWTKQGLKLVNGSVWFKKEIEINGDVSEGPCILHLGRVVDHDQVYLNGVKVGETGYQYPPRRYVIDPALLKKGKNTILMRVISQRGTGGFVSDKPYYLTLNTDTIRLDNTWKYKVGATMPALEEQTFIRWKPSGLHNAMIAPLMKYPVKGIIWYQGESNTKHPANYEDLFGTMIKDWRFNWQAPELPFLYVQLANFMQDCSEPCESNWAELRQAQLNTLKVSHTGMAVTTDLGEWNDIHPVNKKDVGVRLASLAQRVAYRDSTTHKNICPIPYKLEFKDKYVQVFFKDVGTRLQVKNEGTIGGVALSDDGVNFYWADAKVEGNSIKVFSRNKAKAIRYGWSNNPLQANLVNSFGMPVSPFEYINE